MIGTGSYSNIPKSYPGRISISVGSARWHGAMPRMPELSPRGFKDDPEPQYLEKFAALLDSLDPQQILDRAHELAGDSTPVLLCFEKPQPSGFYCHRRLVADWLEDRLGIQVPELRFAGGQLVEVVHQGVLL